jgi:O-acetyl-ADP-ribose deacetylase (regulator of RNase III)
MLAGMTALRVIKGDATSPQAAGPKIIAHVCNDQGHWGAGFVLAVSRRWPEPERDFRRWHRERAGNDFALGAVRLVEVQPALWVANMIGQHGIKTGSSGPPVRYEAIGRALMTVGDQALELGASVHLPRIGCGLAGGEWSKVEPLIEDRLAGIAVTVYAFE